METQVVNYGAQDEITSLRVIAQRCEEQLPFFMKMPDGSTVVEVEEIISKVSTLGDIFHLRNVVEPPRLGQRMMVVMSERYQ